jgi:hypothetical protein
LNVTYEINEKDLDLAEFRELTSEELLEVAGGPEVQNDGPPN